MSIDKQNKFLKNETLFQTLYRINKQVKNVNQNSNNIQINQDNFKDNSNVVKMRINSVKQMKYDNNINRMNNICKCPKNDDGSKIISINGEENHCAICYHKLNNSYLKDNQLKNQEKNSDNMSEFIDYRHISLNNDDPQSFQSKQSKNSELNNYKDNSSYNRNNITKSKASIDTSNAISSQPYSIYTSKSSNDSSSQPSSIVSSSQPSSIVSSSQPSSIVSSSYQPSSTVSSTYQQSSTVSLSQYHSHQTPSTNTIEDNSNNKYCNETTSSKSFQDFGTRNSDMDEQSSILVKIISNLEDRLNNLETKKKSKNIKKK